MDKPRTVQNNPTAAENEAFFSEGSQAWPSAARADIPGVGPTLIEEPLPGKQPVTAPAEPLGEERERLLCQLLFRARQLALKAIRCYRSGATVILICRECHAAAVEGAVVHARKCLVGGVLSVLEDMAAPQHRDDPAEGGAQ